VVVEPLELRAGVEANVGGKPTAVGDADEASRWSEVHTPSNILEEHYQM
jgi:hypothetical protein